MKKIVWIEKYLDIPGATPGIRQPSIVVAMHQSDMDVPAHLYTRLDEIFRALCVNYPTQVVIHHSPIIDRIGLITVNFLVGASLPIFSRPITTKLSQHSYQIQMPTLSGAHHQTRNLMQKVVGLVNAVLSDLNRESFEREVSNALEIIGQTAPRGKNTLPILVAANEAGIPWHRIYGNIYQFGQGVMGRWMDSSITDKTPAISAALANNKMASTSLLRSLGFPVPHNKAVKDIEEAGAFAEQNGFPVVIKPSDQDGGRGVTAGIRTHEVLSRAFQHARKYSQSILVEQHCAGNDHRVHVFEGQVYRVRKRIPGGVTGDGRATIRALLQKLNSEPDRGPSGSKAPRIRIELDQEALELLEEQQLEDDSIPTENQFVQLRRIANVSVGGDTLPVALEDVHPDNLLLATRAVNALKLDIAAVDLLIPDIGRSWLEVGGAICEINAKPQFGPDAPPWILRQFFDSQGRIPVVIILGNHDNDAWIRQVCRRVQDQGVCTGFCSPAGVWVNDNRVSDRPPGLYKGGITLLQDSSVQCLIIVADQSFLSSGLPVDAFDMLVLTRADAVQQHLQLARVLSSSSRQLLIDSNERPWTSLKDQLRCNDCAEAPMEEICEKLVNLLSGQAQADILHG